MIKTFNKEKAHTLEEMMFVKEPRTPYFDPMSGQKNMRQSGFVKQKTDMLISPIKQNSLDQERQDSEMMPGISEIDSRDHPSAHMSIDLKVRKQNDGFGTDPPKPKEEADDFEAELAAISKTMKPVKMEVNMVPVAIATKSGHNKKMSRKGSSRFPLQ